MKTCSKCKQSKPEEEFGKHANRKDGLQTFCRACQRKYRKQNRDKYNRYKKEFLERNPVARAAQNYRIRIKDFVKYKTKSSVDFLGCSWNEFSEHLERQFQEGMSWDNYGEWHIDHIVPLAKAETIEELGPLLHYSNIQPLWAADNLAKSSIHEGVRIAKKSKIIR